MIPSIAHRVDERGLALFDLLDGALQCTFQIVAVFEGAFAVPAHRFRQTGEVGIRAVEVHADISTVRLTLRTLAIFIHPRFPLPTKVISPPWLLFVAFPNLQPQ